LQIEILPGKIHSKSVIIIAGPTGVGKTAVAIKLAQYFTTEIISADSRQCFKELNIGVARPSKKELDEVTHHFIASHSIEEKVDPAVFENYALEKIDRLFEKNEVVVMAGGTGLYIKAFCEGMDIIPTVKQDLRDQVTRNYKEKGIVWLQEQIKEKDPEFYRTGEIQNPQRMMRGLEVMESAGQSVLAFRKGNKASRQFNIIKLGLELPKEKLNDHINSRVDQMITGGLVQEVRELRPFKNLNALQTVGYTEIFDFLDNKISLPEATNLIKNSTRHYAKRQMTWFRKDKEISWFSPEDWENIKDYVNNKISG